MSLTERSRLGTATQSALGEEDGTFETKNRFRLRRPSGQSEFEFRDGGLRVFYRVEDARVLVATRLGANGGNQLFIAGRRVTL